jgi:mono/diheme cytochrome c family protein
MKIKGAILVLALLISFGRYLGSSLAVSRAAQEDEKSAQKISPEQLAQAKTLFKQKCARCHGADGRGETVLGEMLRVPNFTDEKWWKDEVTDERLIKAITHGKDQMPSFEKKLTRQEIAWLAAYVRRFNKTRH